MKCPICDGGGRITSLPSGMPVKCTRCNGTGEVKQTEQEYIQTCNTEQLAEWLNNKIIICAVCDRQKNCEYFINETCHLCPYHEGKNKSWEMWLKQPHREE